MGRDAVIPCYKYGAEVIYQAIIPFHYRLTPHSREATLMTALETKPSAFFFFKGKAKKRKKRLKIKFIFLPARCSTNSLTGMLLLQVSLLIILEAGRQGRGEVEKRQGG